MTAAGRTRLLAVAAALAPGALAGTQIAGLLFFLNPHLPFGPSTVARGFAFFGSFLGAASLLFFLPFLRRSPERVFRWLPWGLTLILAAAALGAWTHASYYAFFLPPGINRRLVKAGILLTLAAVASFYTALVHLRQRHYGPRSRLLFLAIALASVYVVMERREAFKPDLGPGPRATTFAGSPRPQLLVVGIEAATLDAILPLAEQGRLPFFSKMLAEGCHGRITSLTPVERDPLWTTLASGKYPFQHGVVSEEHHPAGFLGHGELNLLPVGIGFKYWWGLWTRGRPVDSGDRRVLTLWEILARLETTSALVGWPLSSLGPGVKPPDKVEYGLSDQFFEDGESERAVWPAELAERARLFRSRRSDLDQAQISRFGNKPPEDVLEALAGDLWRQDLTIFLLEQDPQIDAYFLVLPGLVRISRSYFGGYSAVQFEGLQDVESVTGAQLVAAYYTYLDDFLAKLWERSREPHLLAVVSAHGVEEAHGWRKAWQVLGRQPPLEGYIDRGPDGVLMFLGDAVRPNSRVGSSELVDLVPTLLYGLSFPIARDFDGAVLTNAFETSFLARQPLTFLPSYETFAAPEDRARASEP